MPYSITNSRGQNYFLHFKDVILKNGREQRIYFFAKVVKDEGSMEGLPEGFEVSENMQTGLPVLKKIRAASSA